MATSPVVSHNTGKRVRPVTCKTEDRLYKFPCFNEPTEGKTRMIMYLGYEKSPKYRMLWSQQGRLGLPRQPPAGP